MLYHHNARGTMLMRLVALLIAGVALRFNAAAQLTPGKSTVAVVPLKKLCPTAEWQLVDGEQCVLRSVVAAEAVCRLGRFASGECVSEDVTAAETRCPESSVFDGVACRVEKMETPQGICEASDTLVGGECVKIDRQLARSTCLAKGAKLKDGKCVAVTRSNAEITCPQGFVLSADGQRCDRILQSLPRVNCPPGSILNEDYDSLSDADADANADSQDNVANPNHRRQNRVGGAGAGSGKTEGGGKRKGPVCVSYEEEGPVKEKCRSGGERDALGRCIAVTDVEPDLLCADGFAAVGPNRCEKTTLQKPLLRCPANSRLDPEKEVCVLTQAPEPFCPPKMVMNAEGLCVGKVTAPPEPTCPDRSVAGPQNMCSVQVIYENDLQAVCDAGYELVDGRCLRQTKTHDVFSCGPDAVLSENKTCTRVESVQSSLVCHGVNAELDPAFTLNALHLTDDDEKGLLGGTASMTSSNTARGEGRAEGRGEGRGDGTKSGVVQNTVTNVPNVPNACVARTVSEPAMACDRRFQELVKNECHTRKTYTPTLTCPPSMVLKKKVGAGGFAATSLLGFECVERKTVAISKSCGPNAELTADGSCLRVVRTAPLFTCPANYILGTSIASLAAPPASPPGRARGGPETGARGGLEAEAEAEGLGLARSGAHAHAEPERKCFKTQSVPVLSQCPDEFRQIGNACIGKMPMRGQEASLRHAQGNNGTTGSDRHSAFTV